VSEVLPKRERRVTKRTPLHRRRNSGPFIRGGTTQIKRIIALKRGGRALRRNEVHGRRFLQEEEGRRGGESPVSPLVRGGSEPKGRDWGGGWRYRHGKREREEKTYRKKCHLVHGGTGHMAGTLPSTGGGELLSYEGERSSLKKKKKGGLHYFKGSGLTGTRENFHQQKRKLLSP